jgi:hypothetical protein
VKAAGSLYEYLHQAVKEDSFFNKRHSGRALKKEMEFPIHLDFNKFYRDIMELAKDMFAKIYDPPPLHFPKIITFDI